MFTEFEYTNEIMKIKGIDVVVEYNMRALLMYEKIGGQFNPNNLEDFCFPNNLEDLCKLLYCCVVTGTSDLDITYQEFIDELGKSQSPYVVLLEFRDFLNDMKRLDGKFLSGGESQEEEANEEEADEE